MRSVIFTLINPVGCCVIERELPNNGIRFGAIETLNPVSFPGWPSFGDLLCDGGSRTAVGVTFNVPDEYVPLATKIISPLSTTIAEFKDFRHQSPLGIYKELPKSSWLEIKWSSVAPNCVIEMQTPDVLWYNSIYFDEQPSPLAIGIENLEHFVKQADYNLVVPESFPFPPIRIALLND